MTRPRAVLTLIGLFLLGVVCGGFATAFYGLHHFRHHFSPERMEKVVVRRLARRLDLDETQRSALETVTRKARQQLEQVRADTLPRVEAILDEACDQLKPSLRPEQQKELEIVRNEARERLRKRITGEGAP